MYYRRDSVIILREPASDPKTLATTIRASTIFLAVLSWGIVMVQIFFFEVTTETLPEPYQYKSCNTLDMVWMRQSD